MNKTPLITVIIPFFNSEKFLRETIESVLKQTYPYLELLLIDDGSTDSSTGIAVEYARTYPGIIRYFEHANHENLGANASRNLGIRNSRGEYIAMLDSDDIFLPDKLEIQLKAIKEKPDLVLLGCRAGEIDTEGNFRGTNTPTRGVNKIRWNILLSNQFTHSSIIMRKNIIVQNIELYNESFPVAQEWEFTSRIASEYEVDNLYDMLVLYRRDNPESITSTTKEEIRHKYDTLIRTAGMARIEGWNIDEDRSGYENISDNINRILNPQAGNLPAKYIEPTIDMVIDLYEKFCNKYKLNKHESELLLYDIYIAIANIHCENTNMSESFAYVKKTADINIYNIIRHETLIVIFKCLVGPSLIKNFLSSTRSIWVRVPYSVRRRFKRILNTRIDS